MVMGFDHWPTWVVQALWTVVTIGVLFGVGHVVRLVLATRLSRLAARTAGDWDDVLLQEIGRRIPLWSVLIGLHLSQARWPLTGAAHLQATLWLAAVGVASVTFAVAAVLTRLAHSYGTRNAVPVSGLTVNLIRIVVTLLGALVIVQSFGYDIRGMLAVLGVTGLAVALALQDPLSNLFAGLFVSIAGFVRIGDYVRLDSGAEGYVVDFNWRSARIKQLGDNMLDVPNAKLAQAIVTNYSEPTPEIGMGLDVILDTDNDLAVVERVSLDVARDVLRTVAGAVPTAEPAIRFGAVSEIGIKMNVGFRVRTFTDQYLIRHELIKHLHARFRQEGIRWAEPPVRGKATG
jgi:small-conductance mechanosensitive channel